MNGIVVGTQKPFSSMWSAPHMWTPMLHMYVGLVYSRKERRELLDCDTYTNSYPPVVFPAFCWCNFGWRASRLLLQRIGDPGYETSPETNQPMIQPIAGYRPGCFLSCNPVLNPSSLLLQCPEADIVTKKCTLPSFASKQILKKRIVDT